MPSYSPTPEPTHPTYEPTTVPSTISSTVVPTTEPSLIPTFAPVSADAPVISVQVTQTVAGVTSDSSTFRTAFASAVTSLLPTGSTVTIVSVTVINVRRRQLLTTVVSVVYTVQSTAPASTLTASLSSGTAAMTAVLQVSYPTASVAVPRVVAIANPTAAPTIALPFQPGGATSASAASASLEGSLLAIVVGLASGGGLLLLAGLGYLFHLHHKAHKVNESQIHATSSDTMMGGYGVNYDIQDAERGDYNMAYDITFVEMAPPSINFSGTRTTGSKLQSSVTTAAIQSSVTTAMMGGYYDDSAAGGGPAPANDGPGSPTRKAATISTLPFIKWSALTPSARIGSGSFSAVCKCSC